MTDILFIMLCVVFAVLHVGMGIWFGATNICNAINRLNDTLKKLDKEEN